jgi:hypothetical protein
VSLVNLTINMKTAQVLALALSDKLIALPDEVIEIELSFCCGATVTDWHLATLLECSQSGRN